MAKTKRKITTVTTKRKPRIWEIANEMGVKPSALVDAARQLGLKDVTAPASAVSDEQASMLRQAVKNPPAAKPAKKTSMKAPRKQPAKAEPEEKKKRRRRKKAKASEATETQLVIVKHPKRRGNPAYTDFCLRTIAKL